MRKGIRVGGLLVLGATSIVILSFPALAASTVTLTVTGSSTTAVSLSWTQSGDLCFDYYDIQYRLSGTTSWVSISTHPTKTATTSTIIYLDPATSYDFRIVDVDCVGSAASNIVTVTTPLISSSASPTGTNTISVSWTQSQDDCFDHYQVQYRRQGDSIWINSSSLPSVASVSSSIAGLVEGTAYEVRVLDYDCWSWGATAASTVTTFLFQPELSVTQSTAIAAPGGSVTFAVTVRNSGNTQDTISLSASAAPSGWTVQLSTYSTTLGATATSQVVVTVNLPSSYQGVRSWLPVVTATSTDSTKTASLTLNATFALADLALSVSDIAFGDDTPHVGEVVLVNVTVRNTGTLVATDSTVRLSVSGITINTTVTVPPAGSAIATFEWRPSKGLQTVQITSDPDGALTEFDETNNQAQRSITVNAPDITLAATDIQIPAGVLTEGDQVEFVVTVRNTGTYRAGNFDVSIQVDGKFSDQATVPGLSENGAATIVNFTWMSKAGSYTVVVTLDEPNAIEEINEDNNVASKALAINGRPSARVSAPSEIHTGESVTISGANSTDPDGSVVSYYFDFGDATNSGWVGTSSVSHIYTTSGTYELKLQVRDDKGAGSANNSVTVTVSAPPPQRAAGFIPGFETAAAGLALALVGAVGAASRRLRRE